MKSYYRVILGTKIISFASLLAFMLFAPLYSFGQKDSAFLNLNNAANSLSLIDKDPYECEDMDGDYVWKCRESLKERINWDEEYFSQVKKSILYAMNDLKNTDCTLAKKKVEDASKNISLAREKFQLVVSHINILKENQNCVWWERHPHERAISINFFEGLALLELLTTDLRDAVYEVNRCA